MKKGKIKFYKFNDKINEIKESKAYKAIIRNTTFLSIFLVAIFIAFSYYEKDNILRLTSSINKVKEQSKKDEKMNKYSKNLETINNNYRKKYEILINKSNPITKEKLLQYEIVDVEDNLIPDIKLEKQTYKMYNQLKNNLLQRNYYINIRSGFRTFEDSINIYEYYKNTYGYDYAEKYVAKEGVSEHNTGLALDVIISTDKSSVKTDYQSDEYNYLQNTAYLYGFIIRYPKEKESVTGYEYEPWHLRYVGKELAKFLTKNNLTLEEYYEGKQ